MAFSLADAIEITLHMRSGADEYRNVWTYEIQGVIAPTVTAAHLCEAWWNHMKGSYRASMSSGLGNVFFKISCKSLMSLTGDAGEWAIPTGEQVGTRTPPAGDFAPVFLACAAKLVVPSRLTRPGSKRFFGLYEADMASNAVSAGFQTLVAAILNAQLPNFVLGAPAATVQLNPVIVGRDTSGLKSVSQAWNSFVISNLIATQNTRKVGRGI